jgi:hypothetical protein
VANLTVKVVLAEELGGRQLPYPSNPSDKSLSIAQRSSVCHSQSLMC